MVIQTDILQLMLEDCGTSTDVLKKLFEIGYREPLSRLLNLSKPEIKELFKNKYEACSFLETFKGFGYSDPLQSLFQLDYSMRILLYKNKYEATSIMTALNESSYVSKNPLEYLQVLGLSAMIQMFSDRYQYVKKIKAGEDLRLEFKETSNLGYRL
jgi:hypothetical protein